MEALYYYIPLISLIFLAISIFTDYFFHKLQNLPPRPWLPPLPIIGHLYLLNKPLHRSLAKLSAKHGPIQLLQFGSRRVLVVSSPSTAEECLTKNDIVFANRPQLLAGKYLGYNFTSLVFAPYGDNWRNLRRISTLEIFSSHRLTEFEPIRADEVRHMMCKLYRSSLKPDTVVHVRPMLVELTLNVVMRMISGKRYYSSKDEVLIDAEKEKAHKFQEIVNEILKLMGATNVGDFVPMLRWLGVSKLEKRLISLQAKRDLFMQELLEELKENMENCSNGKQRKNMIQMLLSLQNSEPELYTDELIRSMTLVMLAAGTGTTISTMEWAMSLLLNNPSVLKKAHGEIEKYVGHSRCVEESDMCNLAYLDCIIKETMRMLPPGPLLPHESSKGCMVGGYHVPKGTMLLVNVWAIHNDPNIWGDPKKFRPERFEGLEGYRDGFKLMPFGFGRRGCPGEDMGMRLVRLALGSLIQCFEWERTGESEVDMSEGTEGINMSKAISLVAICHPRATMLNLLSQL
ncbi:putative cytochrome P450 [Helianthus debilis subsp. tardiflorus]